MDQVLEQEAELESQVDTYKSQLSLVEEQLFSSVAHGDEESGNSGSLKELCRDLKQLIELTEESLLELKKQKLLRLLHEHNPTPTPERELGIGAVSSAPINSQSGSVSQCGLESDSHNVKGMKCQAPLLQSWGTVSYHNAVVISRETGDGATQNNDGNFKVKVLFTHPLYPAMKPCAYFLEGNCKFTVDTCKFSHGHSVLLSELEPYQDHDFELAHVGGKCLAKHVDDLWYPAVISSLGETIEVHFSTLNVTAQLELDLVMPQESSDESETSSGSSTEDDDLGDTVRVLQGWRSQLGASQVLAEWEKHTKGVGSKLLAKMGYIHGQGLGKASQGRLNPVEIVVLPPGKTLDACAEIREAKKVGTSDEVKRKKRRKKKQVVAKQQPVQEQADMFEFLNTKIFNKGGSQNTFHLQKDKGRKSSSTSRGNLNIELFKVQEDIKLVKKRQQSLRESLLRHKGKNKAMESHVTSKLANTEQEMRKLAREEHIILKSISLETEQKKLSVF